MILRYNVINNGGVLQKEYFYTCDDCGIEMFEGDPRYSIEGDLCCDCALLAGKITTQEYKDCLFNLPWPVEVTIHEGKIYVWAGKYPPWEQRPDRDYRASLPYKNWRTAVFERDSFTCRECRTVGGKIEAHHIKKFHDFPDLRFDVDNGLTLCRPCHLKEHGRGNG